MAVTLPVPTCSNCGARNLDDVRTCAWCGAAIQPAIPPAIREEPAPPTRSQRFRALVSHPAYPELLAHRPSTEGLTRMGLFEAFGSMVALVVLALMTLFFFSRSPVMGFLPLAMGVIVLVRMLKSFARASSLTQENLLAIPALVLERREIPRNDTTGDRMSWRALVETQDGTRRELEVPEDVARVIASGDMGVAYVTTGYLAGFRRVDV